MKKKSIERKRKQRKEAEENKQNKFGIKWQVLASNIIMAIEDGCITYRNFKQASNRVDEKYWKPSWVPEKKIGL